MSKVHNLFDPRAAVYYF